MCVFGGLFIPQGAQIDRFDQCDKCVVEIEDPLRYLKSLDGSEM